MPVTNTSPNPENYYSGKGIVKWKAVGDAVYRDCGNAPTFEFNPQVSRLEHYSSRQGIRFKDRSVVTQRQATVKMVLEEWTAENLLMALLGIENAAVVGPPAVPLYIDILAVSEIQGALRFVGTNIVGAKMQVDLPNIILAPSAALSLIHAEEWAPIEVTGEVVADPASGVFGRWYWDITDEVP